MRSKIFGKSAVNLSAKIRLLVAKSQVEQAKALLKDVDKDE